MDIDGYVKFLEDQKLSPNEIATRFFMGSDPLNVHFPIFPKNYNTQKKDLHLINMR